jgi:hypothetical protein
MAHIPVGVYSGVGTISSLLLLLKSGAAGSGQASEAKEPLEMVRCAGRPNLLMSHGACCWRLDVVAGAMIPGLLPSLVQGRQSTSAHLVGRLCGGTTWAVGVGLFGALGGGGGTHGTARVLVGLSTSHRCCVRALRL